MGANNLCQVPPTKAYQTSTFTYTKRSFFDFCFSLFFLLYTFSFFRFLFCCFFFFFPSFNIGIKMPQYSSNHMFSNYEQAQVVPQSFKTWSRGVKVVTYASAATAAYYWVFYKDYGHENHVFASVCTLYFIHTSAHKLTFFFLFHLSLF